MLVTDNNGQKLLVNSFCMYVVHNHIPLLDLLKSLSLFHCFERVVECYKWESFHKLDHLSQIPCSLPRRSSWHLGVGVCDRYGKFMSHWSSGSHQSWGANISWVLYWCLSNFDWSISSSYPLQKLHPKL